MVKHRCLTDRLPERLNIWQHLRNPLESTSREPALRLGLLSPQKASWSAKDGTVTGFSLPSRKSWWRGNAIEWKTILHVCTWPWHLPRTWWTASLPSVRQVSSEKKARRLPALLQFTSAPPVGQCPFLPTSYLWGQVLQNPSPHSYELGDMRTVCFYLNYPY